LTAGLSDVDLVDCEFRNLIGNPAGVAQSEADLLVDNSVFTNCTQRAILCFGLNPSVPEQAVIRNSVFIGNSETGSGGGGAVNIQDYGGGVTITDCYFEGNNSVNGGGAVLLGGQEPWTVQNCTFWNNHDSIAGGALYTGSLVAGTLTGCTFAGNGAPGALGGSSILFVGGPVSLTNNVVTGSIGFQAVRTAGSFVSPRKCNVYWNNAGGNTVGFTLGATDRVIDPQYCDAPNGDFTVFDTSPCLPVNSAGCGLIGAHDQGCGSVSVEFRSWGKIKEGYR
jgi:hypothetical protein